MRPVGVHDLGGARLEALRAPRCPRSGAARSARRPSGPGPTRRPLARWSESECGLYCWATQTSPSPRVEAVREREVDQPVGAGEGDGGLGPPVGQQLETATGAAGEDEDEGADTRHAAPVTPFCHGAGMSSTPRSVKISDDERTGWSSERPRRPGEPERPARPVDVSVRGRVLFPGRPHALLAGEPRAGRLPGPRAARRVLRARAGRPERAALAREGPRADQGPRPRRAARRQGAGARRRDRGQAPRRRPLRRRRPRGARAPRSASTTSAWPRRTGARAISCSSRSARTACPRTCATTLGELRTRLDAGELGQEGFATSLRLGGNAVRELKRIVFAPPPRDD